MLHPSYSDLMKVVNSGVEEGEDPIVNSRYSIVIATSKRARQIIEECGEEGRSLKNGAKPLSLAIDELYKGEVRIETGEEEEEELEAESDMLDVMEENIVSEENDSEENDLEETDSEE